MFNCGINSKKLSYLFMSVIDIVLYNNNVHIGGWVCDTNQENRIWLLERVKKKFDVINVEKTILSMRKAFFFIYKVFVNNRFSKLLLLNGIKLSSGSSISEIMGVIDVLNSSSLPYILYWLPGLVTNKKSRIYVYNSYKNKEIHKKKYSFFKDRVSKSVVDSVEAINREIFTITDDESFSEKPKRKSASIKKRLKNLSFLPTLLFSFGAAGKNRTAIDEFYKFGVPIIALVDTDASVEFVQFPIYSNDDTIINLIYFLKLIVSTIERARYDSIIFEHKNLGHFIPDELLEDDKPVTEDGVTIENRMGIKYYYGKRWRRF